MISVAVADTSQISKARRSAALIEGSRHVRGERPDVIVLDLQMPNVDGYSVLEELRSVERTSTIPVIVSISLAVDAAPSERLPEGTKPISKSGISRENMSLFLRNVTQPEAAL